MLCYYRMNRGTRATNEVLEDGYNATWADVQVQVQYILITKVQHIKQNDNGLAQKQTLKS